MLTLDPRANIQRQRELSLKIRALIDDSEGGEWNETDREELEEIGMMSNELIDLVLALDEWRRQGGFDPYEEVHSDDRFLLARLEAEFEAAGGRGVELAEEIDTLRARIGRANAQEVTIVLVDNGDTEPEVHVFASSLKADEFVEARCCDATVLGAAVYSDDVADELIREEKGM